MASTIVSTDSLPDTLPTPAAHLPDLTLEQLVDAGLEVAGYDDPTMGPIRVAALKFPRRRNTVALFERYEWAPADGYLLSFFGRVPERRQTAEWLTTLLHTPLHLTWLQPDGTADNEVWIPAQTEVTGPPAATHKPPPRSARPAPSAARTPRPKPATNRDRHAPADIRTWARANGYQISDRGRIPPGVRASFEASHTKAGRLPA